MKQDKDKQEQKQKRPLAEQAPVKDDSASDENQSGTEASVRDGRRYMVSDQRGQARGRVKYVEGNAPSSGCRFLKK